MSPSPSAPPGGSPPALFRLPFPAILALRYLKSTRKDAFVTFLSLVAGLGLALGVAVLILALGALSGFQDVLISEVLARTPQVEVELPTGTALSEVRRTAERLAREPGVQGVRTVVKGQGWVLAKDRRPQTVELVGIEGLDGFHLAADVAHPWGLEVGDPLQVASPRPTLTPLGPPQPRLRTQVLAGTLERAGSPDELPRAELPLEVAVSLLSPVPYRLEVDAGGFSRAPALADRLARGSGEVLPAGSRIRTWQEIEGPLFFVLRLEKAMMFVAVSLIVLVAALALVASLALVIANKRSEIGMLGAMGATPESVQRAFLVYGLILGGVGALAGAVLGVAGAWVLDRWALLPVPEGVYFLDHVPFVVQPADLAAIVGVTLVLALAASSYSARRAAALGPVEAMRR